MALTSTASDAASAAAVIGPAMHVRPRTISASAVDRSHAASRVAGAAMRGSSVASGWIASSSGSRSAATMADHVAAVGCGRRARPRVSDREKTDRRARRGRSSQSMPIVTSVSCSSSASRGSGRTSSRTRSIAAGSSAPRSSLAAVGRPPRLHRVAAPLFERRVVEERVGLRAEDLVGEDRRLRRVARDRASARRGGSGRARR